MSIPSARISHRRPKAKPSPRARSRAKRIITAEKLAAVLLRYFAEHPKTSAVSIAVQGGKFIMEAKQLNTPARGKSLPIAPAGYFARYYTAELAAEDNRLAVRSTHDVADFIE